MDLDRLNTDLCRPWESCDQRLHIPVYFVNKHLYRTLRHLPSHTEYLKESEQKAIPLHHFLAIIRTMIITVMIFTMMMMMVRTMIMIISIYKLGDVGISSNLIGSLSLTNGHCPPPGRWIMKQWPTY